VLFEFEFAWHPVTKKQTTIIMPATGVSTKQQPVDAGDKGCGCSEAWYFAQCIRRTGCVKDRALQVQGTLQEDEEKGPMMGE
jgi:hypothetical protein